MSFHDAIMFWLAKAASEALGFIFVISALCVVMYAINKLTNSKK
jgi:hypothetical protein